MSSAATVTPNRDHDTENFPTASLMLARPVRAQVMAFYRFVRTADDIADSDALAPAGEARPAGGDGAQRWTTPASRRDRPAGVGTAEARLMLSAFRQDAEQARYADWAALEDYCRRSADPVGRMLLRLHGDGDNAGGQCRADGLCTALQVLNHLQDLVPDRAALDRVYLPTAWMALAGGEAGFFDPANAARAAGEVLDAALDRVEEQLDRASRPAAAAARPPPRLAEHGDHRARPAAAGAGCGGRPGAGPGGAGQAGFRPGLRRGAGARPARCAASSPPACRAPGPPSPAAWRR